MHRTEGHFKITIDQAFDQVIEVCSKVPRAGQDGTWITPSMIRAYKILHKEGQAHSVEVWEGDYLVGGLYGVDAGGTFAGESMFYIRPNASKIAVIHLMNHLHERGLEWMDIQMLTPHMEALGAKEISRDDFLVKLEETLARNLKLF